MSLDHTPLAGLELRLHLSHSSAEQHVARSPLEDSPWNRRPEQAPGLRQALVPHDDEVRASRLG